MITISLKRWQQTQPLKLLVLVYYLIDNANTRINNIKLFRQTNPKDYLLYLKFFQQYEEVMLDFRYIDQLTCEINFMQTNLQRLSIISNDDQFLKKKSTKQKSKNFDQVVENIALHQIKNARKYEILHFCNKKCFHLLSKITKIHKKQRKMIRKIQFIPVQILFHEVFYANLLDSVFQIIMHQQKDFQ
eukprot:TRINITY_DN3897_c1_g1_i17.p1 TRINITY_DN3897_c1_g1~~TRINITY_DN3897_c1_g1_i17.p1  ORF type:complete len:188 (-),score=-13.49 TRINITY_DN3897_c1_g1_i17:431-994(-)